MLNRTHIDQKQTRRGFYPYAEVTKTLRPFDPGTAKYRAKAAVLVGSQKLVKVRHYKGPDGEKRKTIEIEV